MEIGIANTVSTDSFETTISELKTASQALQGSYLCTVVVVQLHHFDLLTSKVKTISSV
jgi:hypothetical protein